MIYEAKHGVTEVKRAPYRYHSHYCVTVPSATRINFSFFNLGQRNLARRPTDSTLGEAIPAYGALLSVPKADQLGEMLEHGASPFGATLGSRRRSSRGRGMQMTQERDSLSTQEQATTSTGLHAQPAGQTMG